MTLKRLKKYESLVLFQKDHQFLERFDILTKKPAHFGKSLDPHLLIHYKAKAVVLLA